MALGIKRGEAATETGMREHAHLAFEIEKGAAAHRAIEARGAAPYGCA